MIVRPECTKVCTTKYMSTLESLTIIFTLVFTNGVGTVWSTPWASTITGSRR